jgi:GGDEF domain-containing protein
VANDRLPRQSEPAIEAVLKKLESEDREVVLSALARAERIEAELRYLADHDSLTGLLVRRRFRAELDQYVSFSARYGGQGAVMIIDIDGLKAVNDAHGHHTGDNLLRQIADVMRERIRTTDIVARLSGDEFAVLMPQSDVSGALQLGEDLRADQRWDHDVRQGTGRERRGRSDRRRPGDVPGEGGGAQPGRAVRGPG